MDVGPIAAGAVAGAVAGLLSSIVAPWVGWSIEKRREQRQHQRELIRRWRLMLAEWVEAGGPEASGDWYALRQQMSPEKQLEAFDTTTVLMGTADGRQGPPWKIVVEDEINRLEREWKLT